MLRSTSDVPASIVLPRLRSCWWCHQPSSRMPSAPSSSRPSFVMRWFCSDQRSLIAEPSGPGMPVRCNAAERAVVRVAQRLQLDPLSCDALARDESPFTRSRATSSSRFTPTSSDAVSAKPSVPRSCSSVVIATCQPWPSSPSRFSTGTSTSLKKISLNSASPVICRSGRTSTPGACMSTIRYVSPW